ncbi:MAG: hypothetical protein ACRDO2_01075 [Nocardioidaceae bacterium]
MLRRAARQVNPAWAYREEKARKTQPGGLQDQDWGWVYAPTTAALFSVAWQLALVAAGLGLTILSTGGEAFWHPRFVPGRLSLGPGPSSGSI